jgi:hypothetical protein
MAEKRLFTKAVREAIPLKIALIGPSGSGKTFTALRLASGIGGPFGMLDSENKRGLHYADRFDFVHLPFAAPFAPERYINAIKTAHDEGLTTLIIDSASHEWVGPGGILEIHGAMQGNSYTNWGKVTPRHNAFIQAIVDCQMNIISCLRGKDDYVLEDDNGKKVPKKIGIGAQQRDGIEYEHTCSFLLDLGTHVATCQKDTTGIFDGHGPQLLTEDHGMKLIGWANGMNVKGGK